jgi:hypothetical protein
MIQFIEDFQEVAHVSGNSIERGDQNNVEAVSAGICEKLVETWTFRFCAGDCVGIFMSDFIPALLCQFAKVVELCFCVLVAGGYARVDDRTFAGTSFSPNFDFGR